MYIAMSRFRIIRGQEAEFERIWKERDIHLNEVPGFVEFHLLRGPEAEDHTVYVSHTIWRDAEAPSDGGGFYVWLRGQDLFKLVRTSRSERPSKSGCTGRICSRTYQSEIEEARANNAPNSLK